LKLPIPISKKVLSIDFGAYEAKIVEGKFSKKNITIYKNLSIKIPEGLYLNGEILDNEQLSYIIKNALKENKVSTELVYGIVNSSSIITREIIIPKVSDEEIEGILSFQIDDYIPVNPENYVVKYKLLGTFYEDNIEKLHLLLIGIPKIIVESHFNLLKEIGLKPVVLDYQGNAISKLLGFNTKINETYPIKDMTIACIDMGFNNTKITIGKNSLLQVSRVVEIGGKYIDQNIINMLDYSIDELEEKKKSIVDINEQNEECTDYNRLVNIARNSLESLMERIEIVFRYYKTREIGNEINLVLLHGGLSNIKEVDNLFSNYFNIPSINMSLLDKIDFNDNLLKYANCIGGLIRMDEV
jgi:type IV pilus assembly protein PilM